MRPSYVRSVRVPDVSAGAEPVPLVNAGDRPVRVVLVSADPGGLTTSISISDSAGALTPSATGFAFVWNGAAFGSSLVLVLAQGQTLFAAGYGAAAQIGVAVSDLFQTDANALNKMRIARTAFRTITLSGTQASPLVSAGKRAQRVVVRDNSGAGASMPIGTTEANVEPGARILGMTLVFRVGAGQQLFAGGQAAVAGQALSVCTSELVMP